MIAYTNTVVQSGLPRHVTHSISVYRWAVLLGKILSELATEGWTPYDISAFTMDRDAITNPNVAPKIVLGMPSFGGPKNSKL